MRRVAIPAAFLLAACSSAPSLLNESDVDAMVAEVEASLPSMTRDTATLVRSPSGDLFVEAHSDSTGYRRIRVVESGMLRRSSATAYYDNRGRTKFVESTTAGLNPSEMMDAEDIEEVAEMVFGKSN